MKAELEIKKAKLTLKIHDREGNLIEVEDASVFTTVGKQEIGDWMRGAGGTNPISHLALGDDDTPPLASDEVLGNELYREAIDSSGRTGTTITITTVVDYGEGNGGGTQDYKECGLFNDPSAGEMFCRFTFPTKTKSASVKWTLEAEIVL